MESYPAMLHRRKLSEGGLNFLEDNTKHAFTNMILQGITPVAKLRDSKEYSPFGSDEES